jgi:TRAP-type mannitol/chloroaromatic compound transport system substrate-binding protein
VKRRDFLKKAGLGATAVAASTAVGAPAVHANKTYSWKMVTTWPPKLPYLQTGADRFAKMVEAMSGGRLKIKVYASGELVPGLEIFDAVSAGTVEMGSGAAYYWAGKAPAAQFFAAVPFGMNAQGMSAWLYQGGGLQLWEELYAPFGLIPRPGGNTGVQMGGWFNKKINTIDDYKGLKMRIPGLGGKVVAKAGGTVVLTAGGEIFTNLERGVIDATEWVGPLHDLRMGFYKAAKYYYYPGWHEPGTVLEMMFNKKAYESLPKDLQMILDFACAESYGWMWSGFDADNGAALQELITKHKVELIRFPDAVLGSLKKLSDEVMDEITAKDPMSKKVYESFKKTQKEVGTWGTVSEQAYYNAIQPKFSLKAG